MPRHKTINNKNRLSEKERELYWHRSYQLQLGKPEGHGKDSQLPGGRNLGQNIVKVLG